MTDIHMRQRIADILYEGLGPTDPYQYMFEKEKNPEWAKKAFFKKRVNWSVHEGASIHLSEDGQGVLIAFLPGRKKITIARTIAEGLSLVFSYRLETMRRILRSVTEVGEVNAHDYDDCIEISALAVRIAAQGQGIGSALLGKFLEDHPHEPIKLDTASARNEAFYARFGFQVDKRGNTGVPYAVMVRRPTENC
jgi:GNAT superfamily N-acetyltransferase